jgi:hypothetical protein
MFCKLARTSRWPSWPTIQLPSRPPGSAKHAWPPLPPSRLPRRQATRRAPGPASDSTRPANRAGPCGAGPAGHHPGPAAAELAGHHRRAGDSDQAAGRSAPTGQAPAQAARGRHHQPGPAAGRGRSDPRPRQQRRAGRRRMRAAPVTRASGKTSGVYFRWAANPRARTALTAFAHNARMQSAWAGRLYADARARGKRNPHATPSSPAPGSASSGPAGTPTRPTTPAPTSPNSASRPPDLTQELKRTVARQLYRLLERTATNQAGS